MLWNAQRDRGCVGKHIKQGSQWVTLLQAPQPVEYLSCSSSKSSLGELLQQKSTGSALQSEESLVDGVWDRGASGKRGNVLDDGVDGKFIRVVGAGGATAAATASIVAIPAIVAITGATISLIVVAILVLTS
jgi:hypothetical protein